MVLAVVLTPPLIVRQTLILLKTPEAAEVALFDLLLPGLVALLLGSLFLGHGATGRAAETLGAVLVVGTIGAWQPRALLHPVPQFFGRISYPLYLSHTLGLMLAGPVVAASGFGTFRQIVVYAVVSLGVAVPVAWLLHVAVEAPMMAARPRLRVVGLAP